MAFDDRHGGVAAALAPKMHDSFPDGGPGMSPSEVVVDQYATANPQWVERRTPVPKVAELMRNGVYRHMPVVEHERVVGIVSDSDVRLFAGVSGLDEVTAADVMVKNPYIVETGTPLMKVASDMAQRRIGSAVVVRDGAPVAIFTATDALRALLDTLEKDRRQASDA
jgi:acetoin utilization protein AcuB